jgi:uncharacterized protein (TIGR00255 family)
MTGYGSAARDTGELCASAAVRGLNHRFLDVSVHLPRRLAALEADVRAEVARVVARGRVEVSVQAALAAGEGDEVVAAAPLAASLVESARRLSAQLGLPGGLTVADVLRFPGVVERVEAAGPPAPGVRQELLGLVADAVARLEAMRRAEGERLATELHRALGAIEAAAGRIEALSAESREARQAALCEKVRELLGELGLDEARLYQEAVRAVERHDVAEEVQRLRSHMASARELVAAPGEPAGKKLDFLAQELMREANTVGSKVQDAALVREVVALKAEIERFREQVQNVE